MKLNIYPHSPKLHLLVTAILLNCHPGQAQLAPKPPPEVPPWETSAAAGLTLTRGNSDTLTAVASLTTSRKDRINEWHFGLEGAYGENSGVKNNESVHGFGQYNHLYTDRFYLFGRADALYDGIAKIYYRLTLTAGPGYYLIKNDLTRLSVEASPGVAFEHLAGKSSDVYAVIRFAERFEHKLNEKSKLWESIEFLPKLDNWGDYVANGEVGLETSLTEKFSLRPYIQDTYRSVPATGKKHNDLKLVVALAYKF